MTGVENRTRRCILGVFAHPDDETSGCAGTFAKYARQGDFPPLSCIGTTGDKYGKFSLNSSLKRNTVDPVDQTGPPCGRCPDPGPA